MHAGTVVRTVAFLVAVQFANVVLAVRTVGANTASTCVTVFHTEPIELLDNPKSKHSESWNKSICSKHKL